MINFRQIKAIEKANKERLLKHFPNLNDNSGIYFLTREENGFKFAYVGKAKHLLDRLAQHLKEHKQHIDNSIDKRGLFSEDNLKGWQITHLNFPVEMLNEKEAYYINEFAKNGYQLYNTESGGQAGKFALTEYTPRKGYREGLKRGYSNAQKDVSKLFSKKLTYSINGNINKHKENAFEKFKLFLEEVENADWNVWN